MTAARAERPRLDKTSERSEDFVAKVRARDPAALDQLVRIESPRVEGLLGRILGPRQDLADLVQNVFVEFLRSVHRFRGDSALSTFLGGIAVQVARRAMRRTAYERRRGEMPAATESHDAGPHEAAAGRARAQHLREALEHIKPKKRIAFCLWAIEGMDIPEIAALTGSSETAVRGRIFHARKELRRRATRDVVLRELFEGLNDE